MTDYASLIENIKSAGAEVVTGTLDDIFPKLDALLASRGATWSQVVRTWFYLKDIDSCYARFNELRTAHYAKHGLLSKLPASTGIGLQGERTSSAGERVFLPAELPPVTAALLISIDEWHPVSSPHQTEASSYGSSFSRAALCGGRLYVSGTASLAGHDVAHIGDFAAQVKETLAAVEAILASQGKSWSDVKRAIAYIKPGASCLESGYSCPRLSEAQNLLVLHADICRPEWLFELEVDA